MKKKIYIDGMSCNHCVNHVKNALEDIGGKNIEVNLDEKYAISSDVTDDKIKETIEDAGYEVVKIEDI